MPSTFIKKLEQTISNLAQQYYPTAKGYYQLRLKYQIARQEQLILVYQMGKVGSSSVVRSIKSNNLQVYNLHTLNRAYLHADQKIYRKEFVSGSRDAITLWQELFFFRKIGCKFNGKSVKIISLVRDPVARNISHFFQWPNMIMEQVDNGFHVRSPSFHYDEVINSEDIEEELSNLYLMRFKRHDRPLVWFDKEMKQNFKIDVYEKNFPMEKGYCIYRNGNTEVMVIKLEKLNEVSGKAFKEFLGIESFELITANIGRKKKTSDLYRRFLDTIKLPVDYLDSMYKSKFAIHFYSKEEIDSFRARWTRSSEKQ